MRKTVTDSHKNGTGKLNLKIELFGKTFQVIKVYKEGEYEDILKEAETELSEMLAEALPKHTNTKVKYLIDEQVKKQDN